MLKIFSYSVLDPRIINKETQLLPIINYKMVLFDWKLTLLFLKNFVILIYNHYHIYS